MGYDSEEFFWVAVETHFRDKPADLVTFMKYFDGGQLSQFEWDDLVDLSDPKGELPGLPPSQKVLSMRSNGRD
jgi:hypothetical protein